MRGQRRFVRMRREVPGTSLLVVPFAIAFGILALSAVTLTFDAFTNAGRVAAHPWLSVGNLDDARAILAGILGAVSTVLALIFSVTLLVFSMAVSQFGPRLMPYFLRDRTMQIALGLFLGTFLQSLTAFVVTGQRGLSVFVPQLTVLTNVLLVFVSFCYLVFYNNRIALAIQTNNVLARIVENLHTAIAELSHERSLDTGAPPSPGEQSAQVLRERCMTEGGAVHAVTSGYVQKLDHARILKAAERKGAVVCLAFRPGQFVLEGELLARVLPAERVEELSSTIQDRVEIGQHRTLEQDIEFAFAQLSEVAIRALSAAINDTYTGLSCLDWLGDALRMFAAFPDSAGAWYTRHGELRLLVPPLLFDRVVRVAFDLIRQAGADNPAVTIRMLQTCARLGPQLRDDEQRRALRGEVEAIHELVKARGPDAGEDRDALEDSYRRAWDRVGPG